MKNVFRLLFEWQDRDKARIVLGSLAFFANQQDGQQRSWLVQGLTRINVVNLFVPPVAAYHPSSITTREQLAEHVPQWEAELTRLEQLPAFLPHSKVNIWSTWSIQTLESM